MTIRELKTLVNNIDEKLLDKEIRFCHEENGYGTICDGAWFDIQLFYDIPYHSEFCITTCCTKEDVETHEGRISWNDKYFIEKTIDN